MFQPLRLQAGCFSFLRLWLIRNEGATARCLSSRDASTSRCWTATQRTRPRPTISARCPPTSCAVAATNVFFASPDCSPLQDGILIYEGFYHDFGPLNLSQLYRFCKLLQDKLAAPELKGKAIVYYSSKNSQDASNAAWLVGGTSPPPPILAPPPPPIASVSDGRASSSAMSRRTRYMLLAGRTSVGP